jgi:hypothetical protein
MTEEERMTKAKRTKVPTTVETTIVVCQCGSATHDVGLKTKTAVALSCSKCGNTTSVKGPVALANVPEKEIEEAVKQPVRPDPDYEPKKTGKKKGGDEGDKKEYTMLRFRVGIEAKQNVIDKAMEAVRVMNCSDNEFREQTWQGHALEFLCADFLAGCDPAVLEVVGDIETAGEEAASAAEGKKPSAVSRKVRDARMRAMEKGAAQLGVVEPGGKDKPPGGDKSDLSQKIASIRSNSAGQDGVPDSGHGEEEHVEDGGRLAKAVRRTLVEYGEEYRADTGETIPMLIDVQLVDAVKRSKKDGGFIIKVLGDERTRSKTGVRPVVYVWIGMEPNDRALEAEIEYSDEMDDVLPTAELDIVELLPKNWEKLPKSKRWPMPSFCVRREIME